MRRDIIVRANPGLSEADIQAIVAATAGLTAREIEPLVAGYKSGQKLPVPPPTSWCRNPITGEYCERHLDPYQLVKNLAAHGLTARVRHGFRRWPLRWLNGVHVWWLNNILFNFRSFFIIVATKAR